MKRTLTVLLVLLFSVTALFADPFIRFDYPVEDARIYNSQGDLVSTKDGMDIGWLVVSTETPITVTTNYGVVTLYPDSMISVLSADYSGTDIFLIDGTANFDFYGGTTLSVLTSVSMFTADQGANFYVTATEDAELLQVENGEVTAYDDITKMAAVVGSDTLLNMSDFANPVSTIPTVEVVQIAPEHAASLGEPVPGTEEHAVETTPLDFKAGAQISANTSFYLGGSAAIGANYYIYPYLTFGPLDLKLRVYFGLQNAGEWSNVTTNFKPDFSSVRSGIASIADFFQYVKIGDFLTVSRDHITNIPFDNLMLTDVIPHNDTMPAVVEVKNDNLAVFAYYDDILMNSIRNIPIDGHDVMYAKGSVIAGGNFPLGLSFGAARIGYLNPEISKAEYIPTVSFSIPITRRLSIGGSAAMYAREGEQFTFDKFMAAAQVAFETEPYSFYASVAYNKGMSFTGILSPFITRSTWGSSADQLEALTGRSLQFSVSTRLSIGGFTLRAMANLPFTLDGGFKFAKYYDVFMAKASWDITEDFTIYGEANFEGLFSLTDGAAFSDVFKTLPTVGLTWRQNQVEIDASVSAQYENNQYVPTLDFTSSVYLGTETLSGPDYTSYIERKSDFVENRTQGFKFYAYVDAGTSQPFTKEAYDARSVYLAPKLGFTFGEVLELGLRLPITVTDSYVGGTGMKFTLPDFKTYAGWISLIDEINIFTIGRATRANYAEAEHTALMSAVMSDKLKATVNVFDIFKTTTFDVDRFDLFSMHLGWRGNGVSALVLPTWADNSPFRFKGSSFAIYPEVSANIVIGNFLGIRVNAATKMTLGFDADGKASFSFDLIGDNRSIANGLAGVGLDFYLGNLTVSGDFGIQKGETAFNMVNMLYYTKGLVLPGGDGSQATLYAGGKFRADTDKITAEIMYTLPFALNFSAIYQDYASAVVSINTLPLAVELGVARYGVFVHPTSYADFFTDPTTNYYGRISTGTGNIEIGGKVFATIVDATETTSVSVKPGFGFDVKVGLL